MSYKVEEKKIMSEKINKLLKKGVIIECNRVKGDFILPAFTREKKDSNMHIILNLKYLNTYVKHNIFTISRKCF